MLDCVKITVNTKKSNYELSTIINYEVKKMRGYKLMVIVGIIEFLIYVTLAILCH